MNRIKLYGTIVFALFLCSFAATLGQGQADSKVPKWELEILSPIVDGKVPATLKNVGSQTQWAVQIGDGSTVGWREPHVYWEIQAYTKAGWTDLRSTPIARCGLYDSDWQKGAVEVAPGETLQLSTEWTGTPYYQFEMGQAQEYRGRLRYRFRGGKARKGSPMMSPESETFGPEFQVVSNWIKLMPSP